MFELLPTIPVAELVVRAVVVYVFILALLRLGGRRHVGEMAPFDLVVLLIMSECVQSSLIGKDTSLVGGLVSVASLVALSHLMGYLTSKSKAAERTLEGRPRLLIRHGRIQNRVLAEERITRSELIEALRREGHTSLARVRYAVLENNGQISFGFRTEDRLSQRPD